MPIHTQLTETLGLRSPIVMGGMQWVGTPKLAAAASNAGALGVITALTQPTPEALKEAIRETRALITPDIAAERTKYGAFAVNITLLPAIIPPDYAAYARAALEEGVRLFETAGSNPGPVIAILKEAGAYVIHKCTAIRHGQTALRLGADMLSIDGCTYGALTQMSVRAIRAKTTSVGWCCSRSRPTKSRRRSLRRAGLRTGVGLQRRSRSVRRAPTWAHALCARKKAKSTRTSRR